MVLVAHAAIALGTLSGGWRIIHTMGSKITRLQPVGGFAAETAGAVSLFTATALGVPVSTTHTITGAIVGVGATRRLSAVRWGIAGQIVWAWVLTIPAVRGSSPPRRYYLLAGRRASARLDRPRRSATGSRTAKQAPPPGRFVDRDAAAVQVGQVLHDRQAEPGAAGPAARLVDAVEPLEDPAEVLGRDARPVVGDLDGSGRRRRTVTPMRTVPPAGV